MSVIIPNPPPLLPSPLTVPPASPAHSRKESVESPRSWGWSALSLN